VTITLSAAPGVAAKARRSLHAASFRPGLSGRQVRRQRILWSARERRAAVRC